MATLLIVEDDRKTNDAICEYLKPAGHKVIPAYDGGTALQLFRQNRIDLVVLDIMLPHISGLSVLHEIRHPNVKPKTQIFLHKINLHFAALVIFYCPQYYVVLRYDRALLIDAIFLQIEIALMYRLL